jgi:hypothetical protein
MFGRTACFVSINAPRGMRVTRGLLRNRIRTWRKSFDINFHARIAGSTRASPKEAQTGTQTGVSGGQPSSITRSSPDQ